ncbi:MAG: hypothetical protein ABIN94_04505 [Ferruginibacter sp.]
MLDPSVLASQEANRDEIIDFMGATVKDLSTLGERSATGISDTRGVLVLEVAKGSAASKFLQANDVILSFKDCRYR